jgi:hypothetical protein
MRGPVRGSVALGVGRGSLAELGRLVAEQPDAAAQHAIQRTWHFTPNEPPSATPHKARCCGFSHPQAVDKAPWVMSSHWTQGRRH